MRAVDRRTFWMGLAGVLILPSQNGRAEFPDCEATGSGQRDPGPDAETWATIKAVTNVFEVGRPEPDYAYVEALNDGRGFTVTHYGFCTYNDEVSSIIRRVATSRPATPLQRFMPHLPATDRDLAREPWPGFPAEWQKEAAEGSALAQACEAEAEIRIVLPALCFARHLKIELPAGFGILFDTVLQHGFAGDKDSFQAIAGRTVASLPASYSERDFLEKFLEVRRNVLLAPAQSDTKEVWSQAAGRVDALLQILRENPELQHPVRVKNDWTDTLIP